MQSGELELRLHRQETGERTTCSQENWSSCCTGRRQEKGRHAVRRIGAHAAQVGDRRKDYMQSEALGAHVAQVGDIEGPHSVRRPGGHVTQVLEKCGTTCSLETWSSCCTGRRQGGLHGVRRLGSHVENLDY
jgi:hypothetical protein